MSHLPIVNLAAYHFTELTGLTELRDSLRVRCQELNLRGTILLTPEGINLFVAGERADVNALLVTLRGIPGLENLQGKESPSRTRPFGKMRIRIKREIIAFGLPEIAPAHYTSRRISPKELKSWLDEGRPVTLLDTRNDFEYRVGTFDGAVPIGIDDFRAFPQAAQRLPQEMRETPVVTFCTGGIRCEKASPYLESIGFRNVLQLDGGILRYFEECGGAHYHGTCFVFDERGAVNAELQAAPESVAAVQLSQPSAAPDDAIATGGDSRV